MLIIKNLTIQDLKNHLFIENFSYSLGNQDKVGIIGEEGNGKSTFLKALYNPKWIEDYMVMSGEIIKDYTHIGYLAQQLPKEWNESIVSDFLLKDCADEVLPYERYNDLMMFETLCKDMHVSTTLLQSDQKMKTLSGGEKVKVQILKLMLQHLDLLLLDEPTNDLDIHTLQWLEIFIKECNIPVIFISHDVTLLNRCANVIIHFEQLNKQSKCRANVFHGRYQEYVDMRTAKLNKDIQVANKEKQEYIKKKIKLNNQMNAVHDALNDTVRNPGQGALLKKKMHNIKALEKRFEKESYTRVDSVEEAIHIYFDDVEAYESKRILDIKMDALRIGERVLLHDVDVSVNGHDRIILIGDNGSGKSCFMKMMYECLKERNDIALGYMPQNYMDLMREQDTPIDFLCTTYDKEDITRSRELLGAMKFTSEEMIHAIHELSEGQKAKLYIVKFIKEGCNVLLLDEPTRNLSPLSSPVIIQMLKDYKGCIIAVSHDRYFIQEMHCRIWEIKQQMLIETTIESV